MHIHTHSSHTGGYLILLVLVFSAVFLIVIFGLVGFVFTQNELNIQREQQERGVQIAEAGLEYYRWYLAHNPNDLTDGTGNPGPYEHEYEDPEDGPIGKFSLEVNGDYECSTLTAVDITSTGWTYDDPSRTRTVYGRYSQPSVAEYSYILNSNVWAGPSRDIKGRYHSNGGIRMDGDNQSLVTSAQETWTCTGSFGCNPTRTEDGVFGSGSGSALWKYPAESVDFAGITLDLVNLKNEARSNGLYFHPVGGQSNRHGYHVVFKQDGTFDVYEVKNTNWVWGNDGSGWEQDYHVIANETFQGNYTPPSGCSVVFFEDKVWLEGAVSSKVTIAAANVTQPNYDPNIILHDNITYTTNDGSDGLTAIAENSILIPLYAPNRMDISGIYIAQKGHFGRNYYTENYPTYGGIYHKRDDLDILGTIVSNGRVGTQWTCGGGSYCSGYASRENTYHRDLANDPPPLTPYVDDEYSFIQWEDKE